MRSRGCERERKSILSQLVDFELQDKAKQTIKNHRSRMSENDGFSVIFVEQVLRLLHVIG